MKRFVKSKKEYKKVEFDADKILAAMRRLKSKRRLPTSVALEEETIGDLKRIAEKKGVPYQVLMRMFILDGLQRMKRAA